MMSLYWNLTVFVPVRHLLIMKINRTPCLLRHFVTQWRSDDSCDQFMLDAIREDSTNSVHWFDRGSTYLDNRQYALAISNLTHAITLCSHACYFAMRAQSFGYMEQY